MERATQRPRFIPPRNTTRESGTEIHSFRCRKGPRYRGHHRKPQARLYINVSLGVKSRARLTKPIRCRYTGSDGGFLACTAQPLSVFSITLARLR
jgi:hypothetical protein